MAQPACTNLVGILKRFIQITDQSKSGPKFARKFSEFEECLQALIEVIFDQNAYPM